MTDEQILRRMQSGQQEALEALMDKYRRFVYIRIANILGASGQSADVEELTMDAFYAVWSHAGSIQSGKLKAYLGITARNRARSFLQARRDLPMDLDTIDIPDPGPGMDEELARKERAALVRKAIRGMRPKDREIFLRYYYYFQTTEEIANILSMPHSTVRSRLARGRKRLKDTLSKEVFL